MKYPWASWHAEAARVHLLLTSGAEPLAVIGQLLQGQIKLG